MLSCSFFANNSILEYLMVLFFLLFDDFPGSCKDSTIVSIFGYTADSLLQRSGMVLFVVGDVLDVVCSLLPIDTKAVAAMF